MEDLVVVVGLVVVADSLAFTTLLPVGEVPWLNDDLVLWP